MVNRGLRNPLPMVGAPWWGSPWPKVFFRHESTCLSSHLGACRHSVLRGMTVMSKGQREGTCPWENHRAPGARPTRPSPSAVSLPQGAIRAHCAVVGGVG